MEKRIKKLGKMLADIERKTIFVDPPIYPVVRGLVDVSKELLEIVNEILEFKEK